ncbi:MAG: LytTR family DNA-binding domain-containing protein [Panacibacter sp.]
MHLFKVIVIDDDEFIRTSMKDTLENFFPELLLMASCSNATGGLTAITQHKPDIVFLDIEMPGMSGFDMLQQIENITFETIFITAHGHYAIKAIRYSALDFLLKPVDTTELKNAIERFKEKRKKAIEQKPVIENFVYNLHAKNTLDFKLAIATTEGTHFIPAQDILRLEADGSYTKFFLIKGKKMMASRTMKDFADLLDESQFIRVHKSHVINKRYVKSMRSNHLLVMEDDAIVEVSRRRWDEVKERIRV